MSFGQSNLLLWQRLTIKHSLTNTITLAHELHARELLETHSVKPTLLMYRPWFTQRISSISTVHFSPLAVLYRNNELGRSWEIRSSIMNEWNFRKNNWLLLTRFGVEGRWLNTNSSIRMRARAGGKYELKKSSLMITDEVLFNTNLRTNSFQNWIHGQWDITVFQKHKLQIGVQCVQENRKYKNTLFFTGLELNL